jgi:hypothetical protein
MPQSPETVTDVARAIQLALAPVFLFTGIAGMLNVMTGRLSRIIDRGRALTEGRVTIYSGEALEHQLGLLEQRRHYVSVAITSCTIAALLVCLVVAILFVEAVLRVPLGWLIGVLFTGATVSLVVGLASFLREVHTATLTVRIPPPGPPSPKEERING